MTTQPAYLTQDELTTKAQRLAVLQERIDADTAEVDAIKAEIRAGVPGPDSYAAGRLEVVVQPNSRFDAKRALPLIPDVLRPVVVETTEIVNKDRLKALAPEIYEQAVTHYDYKVSVR